TARARCAHAAQQLRHTDLFRSRGAHNRPLHSPPTRRSSDLSYIEPETSRHSTMSRVAKSGVSMRSVAMRPDSTAAASPPCASRRSEEHTSELQSRFDLVWRLLLEKKMQAAPCTVSNSWMMEQ